MVVGFDLLSHSRALQAHWVRRLAAYLLDLLLVLLPLWYGLRLLGLTGALPVGLASAGALYGYSAAAEAAWGRTLGKAALGLELRSLTSGLRPRQAALRNLPKLLWFLAPAVDAFLGLAVEGDPRQRLLDRVAGTTVTMSWAAEAKAASHAPAPTAPGGPPCLACGASLVDAGQDFLRCTRCGLIQ